MSKQLIIKYGGSKQIVPKLQIAFCIGEYHP